jgi:hypothetical protein
MEENIIGSHCPQWAGRFEEEEKLRKRKKRRVPVA